MTVVRHAVIRGRVQGVGYRAWIEDLAIHRDLEGWVRNRRDGTVEAVFAGPKESVAAAIEACRAGPRGARVDTVEVEEGEASHLERRPKKTRFAVLPTA